MANPLVSLVVPVLHDAEALRALLIALSSTRASTVDAHAGDYEVIVANGDAGDPELAPIRAAHTHVRWIATAPGRARQMNAGALLARGRWLLFLHADTALGEGWLDDIRAVSLDPAVVGGAFRFTLRSRAGVARLVERTVSWRVRWLGLPYGDQGLVVRRATFEQIGGYRLIPLMEDVDFVGRLRRVGQVVAFRSRIAVSARRYEHDGWWRRTVRNAILLGLFWCGVSPRRLAGAYYRRRLAAGSPPVDVASVSRKLGAVAVVIPALDEAEAIGLVLAEIPPGVGAVVVVDNGSTDGTAAVARRQGATVVSEPHRGYGRACLAGLLAVGEADIVVFLDADRSDFPADVTALVAPILSDDADLVMGCRHGVGRPLSARLGTAVCVKWINWVWGTYYEDLGPFRAIRRSALERLAMSDPTYGWTIEMQVKAAETNLRVLEIPIAQRPRVGRSKISGTLGGTLRAGARMLTTIWSLRRTRETRYA